jgi:outer membrane autotransporter protein
MDLPRLNTIFHKTLLALTISACASQAFALDYAISQGPTAQVGQNLSGGFNVTGQDSLQATAAQTIIEFRGTSLQGSLTNNATITVDAAGFSVDGLGVDQGFGIAGSLINGDVRNNGVIALNNVDNAEGIEIGNASITGSVVNAGTVSINQSSAGGLYGEPEGMYLHGTQIGGDLVNAGTIEVNADYAIGLIIDSNGNVPFSLGGTLINSGSIIANGDHALAFDIESDTSALNIANSGLIRATGAGSEAITLWGGTVDVLNNSGSIVATGDDTSRAIVLQGATFTDTLASGQRGIVNSGTISAQGDAIVVTGDAPASGFEINQNAGLISSTTGAAIRGGNLATLNWAGGDIAGDLLAMKAVNVKGQAGFAGTTIDSNVAVSNGGSLNLASAGKTITGNLDIASGSGVDMRLSNATVNTAPYLTVGGTASFANGSQITLSANPGDFTPSAAGKTYALVSAAKVQDNGLSVASSSALLDVSSYAVGADSVAAVVTLKSDQEVVEDLGSVGVDQPTQGIVNTLKNDVIGKLDANDQVYKSFANASTAQDLARLSKQLAPEVSRGGIDAALAGQNASNTAINTRINGLRSGLASGDGLADAGVWVQALNSNMDQDSRSGVAGYSANASGVAVGADGKLNANTTVGLAYSYVNANVTADTGNKTDVHGNALALYGGWEQDGWFTQGSLGYGRNDNDSKRYVAGTLAKGSYDSDVLSVNVLGGYGFKINDSLLLEPRVAARYANVQVDGYSEHGSSAALRNGDQRFETGEIGAGLRVAANAPLLGGTLQPEATLMAYHDLIGDRINQTSAFTQGGSSFAVTGAKAARDTYEGSLGVNYSINALTVGASYNYQAKSGYDADTVMFKARYAF